MVDCAAAAENMLLAAHALGLGAVWTGVYPREGRMAGLSRLLGLPQHVVPHSLIVAGHPAEQVPAQNRYRPERRAAKPLVKAQNTAESGNPCLTEGPTETCQARGA